MNTQQKTSAARAVPLAPIPSMDSPSGKTFVRWRISRRGGVIEAWAVFRRGRTRLRPRYRHEKTRALPRRAFSNACGPVQRQESRVYGGWLAGDQLAQHKLQNASVGVVLGLLRGVDAHQRVEFGSPAGAHSADLHLSARSKLPDQIIDSGNLEDLFAGQIQRLRIFSGQELQWQNAHAHEIRAVDALVTLRDYGAHAQQARALGRPVAGGTGTVLLAGNDHQGHAVRAVFLGSFEDGHLGPVGRGAGESALKVRHHFVAQTGVGECAPDHDLVIAAARSVGIEVHRLYATFDQILAGRAIPLDGTGRRNVVGGHAVAEHGQDSRVADVLHRRGLKRHIVEVGSAPDVS